ncbi:MAG TPA: hypothetical protein PLG23_07855, partial [Thermoflexales bacterium]|nr:hypothetical protein [Thermoflexales bacterium]HQZ53364.1 hypothetical protein [Thermoflexales bacterium]
MLNILIPWTIATAQTNCATSVSLDYRPEILIATIRNGANKLLSFSRSQEPLTNSLIGGDIPRAGARRRGESASTDRRDRRYFFAGDAARWHAAHRPV